MDVNQQEVAALERQVGDQATSPLFAKLAYLYLETGRAQDALRVCDAGLANFPFYSTGHLIKGKTLQALGMHGEARREFEFVRDWLPTNATVAGLLAAVPLSDDQMLEAPSEDAVQGQGGLSEPAAEQTSATDEPSSGGDFFSAMATEVPMGGAVEPEPATDDSAGDSSNVFGLPGDAPTTAPNEEASDAGQTTDSSFGGMEAFAQFGGSGAAAEGAGTVEEDFEAYAQRKRAELGPTDVMTIDEYLSSPAPGAGAPAEEGPVESAFSTEDPFAAAGFGTAEPPAPDPAETVDEEGPPQLGGITETPEKEAPAPFGGFEETPDDKAPPQFGGFGETIAVPESAEETTEETESPGSDAFGLAEETPAVTEEEPVAEAPAFSFETTEEPTVVDSSEPDTPAGFAGDDVASPEQASAEPASEEQTFPDFSGMPAFDGPDVPEEEVSDEPEMPIEDGGFSGPPMEEPTMPQAGNDRIGEFAEKLQDAKRITPVIDLTTQVTSTNTASADEAAVDAGFVTPTLAEIYAKQGWYDDAINAYRTLAKTRPTEKEKFEQRVKELQEEKAKAD